MSVKRERTTIMSLTVGATSGRVGLLLADPPSTRVRRKSRKRPPMARAGEEKGDVNGSGDGGEQTRDAPDSIGRLPAGADDTETSQDTTVDSPDAALPHVAAFFGPTVGSATERRSTEVESHASPLHDAPAREQDLPVETTGHLRQLAAVVDAFTDSVLIFDGEGHILHANAADRAMLSYDARTAGFATTVRERARVLIQRGEDGQPISEDGLPVARVLRGESFSGHSAMEVTIRTADGRDIQVSSSGAPVLDAKGHVIGGVVVTRDVTDPRHLERTLRDANWRMDEILAVAAHDLRTPITASRGYVQLATRRLSKLAAAVKTKMPALVGNIEQLRRALEDAELSTQRLARLVDRLLDVARVQGNKLELRREVVDLATIVSGTVYEQQLAAPTRTIRSNLLPRGRSVAILADPDRIGQVLLNFLANALKYSPEDSVICVTLTVSDTAARVSVRDEGSGIPEAEQNRIWLRFEQAEYGRQHRSASGLGLGLYISRAIVEAHGGLVGVESEIGRGSTFWFDLPLAPDAK